MLPIHFVINDSIWIFFCSTQLGSISSKPKRLTQSSNYMWMNECRLMSQTGLMWRNENLVVGFYCRRTRWIWDGCQSWFITTASVDCYSLSFVLKFKIFFRLSMISFEKSAKIPSTQRMHFLKSNEVSSQKRVTSKNIFVYSFPFMSVQFVFSINKLIIEIRIPFNKLVNHLIAHHTADEAPFSFFSATKKTLLSQSSKKSFVWLRFL